MNILAWCVVYDLGFLVYMRSTRMYFIQKY